MNKKEKLLEIMSTIMNKKVDESCSRNSEESWDSITHIEIIVTIEEEFGITIPQEIIPELTSVNAILEVLEELC